MIILSSKDSENIEKLNQDLFILYFMLLSYIKDEKLQ